MSATPSESMDGFRFVFPIDVRFRDLDMYGHVNNVVYLTYLESARLAWWMHVSGRPDLRDVTMILARTEIDYRRPVVFGERLRIGVRCVSMRRASFVLSFRVECEHDRALRAEARKVLVHYDYARGCSTPLPGELRARILAQDPDLTDAG